jgi:uncharacterized protein YndB with AHSA1/START domain
MSTDHIEKKIVLRASRSRVWRAVSNAEEFGQWFGMRLEGPFRQGEKVSGVIVPTKVDAEIAAKQKPHEGTRSDLLVEAIEPERRIAFRWHPAAVEEGADYSAEPTTLVEFTLEDAPGGGVLLTVRESGFDRVPLVRRAEALKSNNEGWALQMTLIEKYLAQTA